MIRALRQGVLVGVIVLCACCALAARAIASDTESSMLIDDNRLIYSSATTATATLHQLRALGVDEVKVSLVWQLIAPDAGAKHAPRFDATDPAAYPQGVWARYDRIVRSAHSLGLRVDFQFVGPAPVWARQAGRAQGPDLGRMPTSRAFEQFVQAAGRRYDGHYSAGGSNLPRVTSWELWNEPNEHAWLNPWLRRRGRRRVYLQPAEYRSLLDAGWSGLMRSGHRGDTILIGETANVGTLNPIPFIRDLYCVNARNRPLSGLAAADVECPRIGRGAFVAEHPALFRATGFAHHPYAFATPPAGRPPKHYIAMANLGTLEGMLNGIFSTYRVPHPNGVALYLTEWGFESDPPDPYISVSAAEQATYLDQGEYMTWQHPYVKALAQFELVDDAPRPDTTPGSRKYWNTFQTGLVFGGGQPKPSYAAYLLPVWVPHARHGAHVAVWGQLRPADHDRLQYAVIEFAPRGSSAYATLGEAATTSPEGFFLTHVAIPSAGTLRVAWLDSSGDVHYSRSVAIS